MRYLLSVIDDEASVATEDELTATGAFNDRLRTEGHWVFAGGLASSSTATVIENRGPEPIYAPTARSWNRGSTTSADSGSSRPATQTWRSRSPTEAYKHCNRRVEVRPFHDE